MNEESLAVRRENAKVRSSILASRRRGTVTVRDWIAAEERYTDSKAAA